ncbi:hypothetical protein PVAND_011429 [Polypedilum vanderplanki]|uniref:UBX domain-containing protein n=1 Tax=Polypedilum vanderplanki TaxID=319348 RepID=A0A9J6CKD3_POLVA|nr:hypothetical protein PVAND_011429 [Polypedilum vanderplanki]
MEEVLNKEEILANFQQITAIEDIGIALSHLESTGWDLETAVRIAILMDGNENESISIVDNDQSVIEVAGPSTSTQSELTFNIRFKKDLITIKLSELQTVGELKQLIMKKTSVPVCRQNLKMNNIPIRSMQSDSTKLKALNFNSNDINLELTDISNDGIAADIIPISPTSNSNGNYQLRIYLTNENRYLNLNFAPSKTLLEIKNDVFAVLKTPVRFQVWEGWPSNATNDSKLSDLDIDHIHCLQLTCTGSDSASASSSSIRTIGETLEIDSDSDSIEFEDATADEDMFTEEGVQPNRLKHLIEDGIEDTVLGSLQFVSNYRERYGVGPTFFEGSLEDALKTAYTAKSAKDRKLLAIYLHHDNSVLSNVFCGQLLGNENIIKLLNENYILFGWDLTFESNKNLFLSSLTASATDSASLQIRNMAINQFPIILIIRKFRGMCEIADIIHGNINRDELYIHLMMNSDAFNEQMKIDIREENERAARESLLLEQQQAYQESLLADRAKEEERLRLEKMMENERQKQESELADKLAKKEADRRDAENSLPPEPTNDCTQQITKIRFRKPTGDFIERKFTVDTQLKVLLNFSKANGFSPEDFKIISSFPRRDLTTIDSANTLKQLNLYPQETLILEER